MQQLREGGGGGGGGREGGGEEDQKRWVKHITFFSKCAN